MIGIGYYKRESRGMFTATSLVCDLALLYVFSDSLNLGYNYYAVAAGIALLGTSLAVLASEKFGRYYFEKLLEPIKVILLSYAGYELFSGFAYTEESLFTALIGLIFATVCIFRSGFMKKLYFTGGVLVTVWTMLANVREFAPIVWILSVVSLGILLAITFKAEDVKFAKCKELVYGLLLISIALASLNTFTHFGLKLIGIILLAVVYSILFIAFDKNDILRCFTVVALLIPYVIILPISVWNDNVNYILYCLPWLALIFIYTRGFLISVNIKFINIAEIVILSVWYLVVSSKIALEVALFIGTISFAAILAGYKNENRSSLYYTGVAFLVVNTLVQLNELWTSIPMWAYILLAGLLLIGIVTYKEYSRVNKKEKVEKAEVEIVGQPEVAVFKQPIDVRTVVAGSVLYAVFIPILIEVIL